MFGNSITQIVPCLVLSIPQHAIAILPFPCFISNQTLLEQPTALRKCNHCWIFAWGIGLDVCIIKQMDFDPKYFHSYCGLMCVDAWSCYILITQISINIFFFKHTVDDEFIIFKAAIMVLSMATILTGFANLFFRYRAYKRMAHRLSDYNETFEMTLL